MNKRVLITGASGLLGRAIFDEFKSKKDSWEVLGLAFTRTGNDLRRVDLRSNREVESVIHEFKPNIVIHSAAERRPDFVERHEEDTASLNVTASQVIAECATKEGAFTLYISTDYVFDGTSPPYKPTDKPNPLNKYGQSKLEGENATLKYLPNCGVLRVPILYGPIEYLQESAVTGLFELIKNKKEANVSNYEWRYPTSVKDIATVCRQIAERRLEDDTFSGIWHWRSDDKLTKYQMVKIMGEIFGLSTQHITADNNPSPGAKRPFDCEFDCSDLERIGICQRTPFVAGISECLAKFT
ncbi:methionine adenosyltransferase 2 subunit beta-like [Rhopilema esculentum]|uniref:methionine adenosyltransferase 2 subunit beta-like n=1 Tax=Rhopilema esculentum TaxID=499914 RepID=UPI0031D51E72|eukprot:gene775-10505_t